MGWDEYVDRYGSLWRFPAGDPDGPGEWATSRLGPWLPAHWPAEWIREYYGPLTPVDDSPMGG